MATWSFGFLQPHVRGGTIGLELRHSQPVGTLHIPVEKVASCTRLCISKLVPSALTEMNE